MKLTCHSFFKTEEEFQYIDLNSFYLGYSYYRPSSSHPSTIQQNLFNQNLDELSFGGYGENRKNIWKNTYLAKNGNFIHLGIDIQMSYETVVHSPFDAKIIDRFIDKDRDLGWGGRLILERNGKLLVLGHLAPKSLTNKTEVKKGDKLGIIGTYPDNGNVFEHLHIQVINRKNINNFDGYGYIKDLKDNPDPFNVEW